MNFPYQILEYELESLFTFYKRWNEEARRAVLVSVLWIEWFRYRFQL